MGLCAISVAPLSCMRASRLLPAQSMKVTSARSTVRVRSGTAPLDAAHVCSNSRTHGPVSLPSSLKVLDWADS